MLLVVAFFYLQIFDVLRVVGKQHAFSAGLVIGGKDLEAEQAKIGEMNILVCTPGMLTTTSPVVHPL